MTWILTTEGRAVNLAHARQLFVDMDKARNIAIHAEFDHKEVVLICEAHSLSDAERKIERILNCVANRKTLINSVDMFED